MAGKGLPARFLDGMRQFSGGALNDWFDQLFSVGRGYVALAGGGKPTLRAYQLDYGINTVDTVASAADSVLLPPAQEGLRALVTNRGANSMQVFGSGSATINGVATGTGVAHAAGLTAEYVCVRTETATVAGQWVRMLSA